MRHTRLRALFMPVLTALVAAVVVMSALLAKDWQDEFPIAHPTLTPTGASPYSILDPWIPAYLSLAVCDTDLHGAGGN